METLPGYLKPLEKVTFPFPSEAVEEAIQRWEESAPYFLDALTRTANDPESISEDYLLHEYALRLFAQHRDTRAYEPAVRLARLHCVGELLDDTITQDLGRILAAISGGDTRLIKALIEDPDAEEFSRASGLTALGVLCRSGQLARQEFSDYLGELFASKLVKDESYFWTALADLCATFGFSEHEEAVTAAWEENLLDPTFADWKKLGARLRSGVFDERDAREFAPFDDTIGSMEWWACFTEREAEEDDEIEDDFADEPHTPDTAGWEQQLQGLGGAPAPYRAEPKVGRNDPCPCGSGKKYKKCCG